MLNVKEKGRALHVVMTKFPPSESVRERIHVALNCYKQYQLKDEHASTNGCQNERSIMQVRTSFRFEG